MSIAVYQVQSPLAHYSQDHTKAWLKAVEDHLPEKLETVDIETYKSRPFGLVFVASGGSEALFLENFHHFKDRSVYILTSGESNSLAASMEILAYLKQHGKRGEILHGSAEDVARRISALHAALNAKAQLNGMRLGIVGDRSDWLIASSEDGQAYKDKLGITLVKISMDELLLEYKKGGYPESKWTEKLKHMGYDAQEMEKSLNIYGAFRRLCDKYDLKGMTVRCFDLLTSVKSTGCLGLAILNAEGFLGGCEGDVPSLISMAILRAVSGKSVFMCNPSRIDTKAGEMVLAHCTLPLDMPTQMHLTTHYESGIGVAIAGHISEEVATIFKTSCDLNRYFAKAGLITANLHETHLCRTQIKLKLDDFSYFLTDPIQNHHLVTLGDHTAAIEELFRQID